MKDNRFLSKLKLSLEKTETSTLISNFCSLVTLQVLNVVLPFLTMPYLISVLGIEKYGLLGFANTIALLFCVFVEFGFNNSATREISAIDQQRDSVQQIFNEVLSTKIFLLTIVLILYCVFVFSIPKLRVDYIVYLLYAGIIIGMGIFPLWFFQGIQKMKYITYINVFFKSIFTIFIFFCVKKTEDIWLVPTFISSGFIVSGIASLFVIKYKFGVSFRFVSFNTIKEQLQKSYHLFLSELYMTLLAYSNVLILGFFAGDLSTGIYTSAEKVIRAAANLLNPIVNVLFPFVNKVHSIDPFKAKALILKVLKIGSVVIGLTLIVTFIFADHLFFFLIRDTQLNEINQIVIVFRILCFFPLLSFLDQVLGKLVLISNGFEKQFSRVFFISMILNIISGIVLTNHFNHIGAAISNIFIQFFIAFGMYYYTIKYVYKMSN